MKLLHCSCTQLTLWSLSLPDFHYMPICCKLCINFNVITGLGHSIPPHKVLCFFCKFRVSSHFKELYSYLGYKKQIKTEGSVAGFAPAGVLHDYFILSFLAATNMVTLPDFLPWPLWRLWCHVWDTLCPYLGIT